MLVTSPRPFAYLLVLTHQGVTIYHTHKDGDPEKRLLTYWFTLEAGHDGPGFDVRELPGAGVEPAGLSERDQWIADTLRMAIEHGQLPQQASATHLSGQQARVQAAARAQASGQDWVSYRDFDGQLQAELLSRAAVRRAVLAASTRGSFTLHTSDGDLRMGRNAGLNLLRQLRAPVTAEQAD